MTEPILYRRRIIPDEYIFLKDDRILLCEQDYIITKWNALKPKKDLHHGYSCYFLKEGFKVSKFYTQDNVLICCYCDIIECSYHPEQNKYDVTDLLADVIVYPDGSVKIVDLDELADASASGKLSQEQMQRALRSLNTLLQYIYRGEFSLLRERIEQYEK